MENNPNSYGWEIYSWELPIQKVNISVFDKNHDFLREKVQTFHIYESLLILAAPSIESFKKSKVYHKTAILILEDKPSGLKEANEFGIIQNSNNGFPSGRRKHRLAEIIKSFLYNSFIVIKRE